MVSLTPIILCGGSGERLWPLSRKSYPKQFLNLVGEGSLFQQAALRLGIPPVIVTGDDYRFLVRQQLHEAGIGAMDIIIEPSGKNTAPAILAAAHHLMQTDPDARMLVMPSDHYIPDSDLFADMIETAGTHLGQGQIICFGISPDRPETGYGYIHVTEMTDSIMKVESFTEKPDEKTAQAYLDDGTHLWNAGIFMLHASDLLTIAQKMEPDMHLTVQASYKHSSHDLGFIRLDATAWEDVPAESFDYAFMEKSDDIGCIAFRGEWSDLGDWKAVSRGQNNDEKGNILHGHAYQIDSENTLLWASEEGQVLTGIGLKNIMAISMGDAVLVADTSRAQDVKALVADLKQQNVDQATKIGRDNRPWGWFETIALGETFHAKILHIYPGAQISLQSHQYRSEHWVVVNGIATVIRNDEKLTLHPNESVYIHVGEKHQLRNDTDKEIEIIEVQTGHYFGEDDIIRYEDIYHRGKQD